MIVARHKSSLKVVNLYYKTINEAKKYNPDLEDFHYVKE